MKLSEFAQLTRIEQTLFTLPTMLSGALLALWRGVDFSHWLHWLWIFPAFLLARISGMAFNQLIDRKIDGKNPRTQNRLLPTGRVSVRQARYVAWGAVVGFVLVCAQINLICMLLAPFAAFLLFSYSYLKRIHASCHFILGLISGLAPVMAAAAIAGSLLWEACFLGLAVLCLIAANDSVYALQDLKFDRTEGLHSMPAALGIDTTLLLVKWLHGLLLLFLTIVGFIAHVNLFYFLLIPAVALFLLRFHRQIAQHLNGRLEPYFFSCNVSISLSIFLALLVGGL